VAAIIEVRNNAIKADASQGTHFFQNITSLNIPYLTLDEGIVHSGADQLRSRDFLDWQWLAEQEVVEQKQYVRHVRTEKPFIIKCDGTRSESIMYRADAVCNQSCSIEGETVWNTSSILQGEC
jgi:hypothetical protein